MTAEGVYQAVTHLQRCTFCFAKKMMNLIYQDGRRIVYFRPHNDKINPTVIPHEIVPGCRSRLVPEEKRCTVAYWGSNFSICDISGISVSIKKSYLPYLPTPKESTIEIHQG